MKRPRKSNRQLASRKLPPECLCCGSANPWVANTVEISAPFRGITHTIQAQVHQCRHCDAIATTEHQAMAISEQCKIAHCEWISKRFKSAKERLGLSIRALVELTGIPQATLARASSGDRLIEATIEEFLWNKLDLLSKNQLTDSLLAMRSSIYSTDISLKVHVTTSSPYTAFVADTASSSLSMREDDSLYASNQEASTNTVALA